MDKQPGNIWETVKRTPAWMSGGISLVTALIGFILLLRGNFHLGITLLTLLVLAALIFLCAYLAFSKTPPLITGGKGVYRFEKYRTWAFIGLGLIIGLIFGILLNNSSRTFIWSAFSGRAISQEGAVETQTHADPSTIVNPQTDDTTLSENGLMDNACMEQILSDVPRDRIFRAELGVVDQTLISEPLPLDEIFAVQLTNLNQLIAVIKLIPFPQNDLFKILTIGDANCQEVTNYHLEENKSGDHRVMSDGDPFHFILGEKEYALKIGALNSGRIILHWFKQSEP